MERYFRNPYEDYKGGAVSVDDNYIRNLINEYVATIITNTHPNKVQRNQDKRGDLYVGNAGKSLSNLKILNTNIVLSSRYRVYVSAIASVSARLQGTAATIKRTTVH